MSQFVQALEGRQFFSVTPVSGADAPVMTTTAAVTTKAATTPVSLIGKTYTGTVTKDGVAFTYTLVVTAVDAKRKITGTLTLANTALNINKSIAIDPAGTAASGTVSTAGNFSIRITRGQTATSSIGTLGISGTLTGKPTTAGSNAALTATSTLSLSSASNFFKLNVGGKINFA